MDLSTFVNQTLNINDVSFKIEENRLNQYDRYTYHFTLSMVGEIESRDANIAERLRASPSVTPPAAQSGNPTPAEAVRKIIVAQSGVTTGINLVDVEIDDSIGSNLRYKNTTTFEIRMTLTEPYGINLIDQMFNASKELGVQNWRLAPLFLELDFKGYKPDGSLASANDLNIRKVWKITLVDMESNLTQVGTTYKIKAIGQNTVAFLDYYYQIPSSTRIQLGGGAQPAQLRFPVAPGAAGSPVSGTTIASFFDQLATQLTLYYTESRRTNGTPIIIYEFKIAEKIGEQRIDLNQFARARRLPFGTVSQSGGEILVSRGISITSLLDDLISSTVIADAQNPWFLESSVTGIVIVPRVECIVQNIGYDGLNNDYIRKLTFVVSAKRTTRPTLTRSLGRSIQLGDSGAATPAAQLNNQRERLKIVAQNSLRKAYPYYYTGFNTEIVNLNVVFQNMHIIPLPMADTTVLGAGDYQAIQTLQADAESRRRAIAAIDAQLNVRGIGAWLLPAPNVPALRAQRSALEQELAQIQRDIERIQRRDTGLVVFNPDDEASLQGARSLISPGLRAAIIAAEARNRQLLQQRAREFVEDQSLITDPGTYTYIADPRDVANTMSRAPAGGQEDRARQLYSTVLAQIYDRNLNQLSEIEMDIRGDPYWLGKTNIEREQELLKIFEASPPAQTPSRDYIGSVSTPGYANYYDYDAHFLLIFRAGQPPEIDTGLADLSKSVWFTAIYQAYQVTHKFSNGAFTQKLTAVRDGLINLGALRVRAT